MAKAKAKKKGGLAIVIAIGKPKSPPKAPTVDAGKAVAKGAKGRRRRKKAK